LSIGVNGYKFNSAKAGIDHAVKGIDATTANSNNLDYR
jgi:hypothetical protein